MGPAQQRLPLRVSPCLIVGGAQQLPFHGRFLLNRDCYPQTYLHSYAVPSEISVTPEPSFSNVYGLDIDTPPMKRRRLEDCNEDSRTPLKQSIKKFDGDWAELLDEYDDELNCPMYASSLTFSNERILITQNILYDIPI